jgi:putative transposase
VDSQSLQQALRDLDRTFVNFFENRARSPRFKNRRRDWARFLTPQRVNVNDGKVYISKVGHVRIRQSQPVTEPTKSATFGREADGNWYVSLTVEFKIPDATLPMPEGTNVVGIHLGLIDFARLSGGSEAIPAPRFYRKAQRKLREAQRTFCRRQLGSKRKAKARIKVARVHQMTTNQRSDFLHKLTTGLVPRRAGGLCMEDLSVCGLARTKLAKSFTDAAMGEFRRQLTYKATWNRKRSVVIDRYFPSSKLCNVCGAYALRLPLDLRVRC